MQTGAQNTTRMKDMINYKLIRERRWSEFLRSLSVGNYTVPFSDIRAIRSMTVVAYKFNSDNESDIIYNFTVNKLNKTVTIKVMPREDARVIRANGYDPEQEKHGYYEAEN